MVKGDKGKSNPEIAPGIHARGHGARLARRVFLKKAKGAFKKTTKKAAAPAAAKKAPRWYPADDVKRPHSRSKFRVWNEATNSWTYKAQKTRLRASVTPGTVLILLSGRYRGKRVVFLKQLPSGLLLVTGPYKVNGVPIRRVNQAYVIATSTKIDLPAINLEKFDDKYFAKEAKKSKKSEDEFFQEEQAKTPLPEGRKADQKAVDAPILAAVKKVDFLKPYLHSRFSLSKGQAPHHMAF